MDPPQEVVAQLLLGRHAERRDPRPLRVEGGPDLADQAVLAAPVQGLEHDEQRLAGLGPQPLLEVGELVAQLLHAGLRRGLVPVEAGRAARIDGSEVGPSSRRDPQQIAEAHAGLCAVRYWAPNGSRKEPSAPRGRRPSGRARRRRSAPATNRWRSGRRGATSGTRLHRQPDAGRRVGVGRNVLSSRRRWAQSASSAMSG